MIEIAANSRAKARASRKPSSDVVIALGIFGVLFVTLVTLFSLHQLGFIHRVNAEIAPYQSNAEMFRWRCPEYRKIDQLGGGTLCVVGAPWKAAEKRGILWGDSHALHFAPLVDITARKAGISLVVWYKCPPYIDQLNVKRWRPQQPSYSANCAKSRAAAMNWIGKSGDAKVVVLASAWYDGLSTLYQREGDKLSLTNGLKLMEIGLAKAISTIDPTKRDVLVMAQFPRFQNAPQPCNIARISGLLRRKCDPTALQISTAETRRLMDPVNTALEKAVATTKAQLIQTNVSVCQSDQCLTRLNGEFLYMDAGHIRRNLTPQTRTRLAKILGLDAAFAKIGRGARATPTAGLQMFGALTQE